MSYQVPSLACFVTQDADANAYLINQSCIVDAAGVKRHKAMNDDTKTCQWGWEGRPSSSEAL